MFNKDQVEAYSNIKAPDELFDKVLNAKPKKSKIYYLPLAVSFAACIMLMFGVAVFTSSYSPSVTFNGQVLTDSVVFYDISPANAPDMRSSPMLSIPVIIESDKNTEVTVSEGVLVLENGKRQEYSTFEGEISFVWEIERTSDFKECKMTLTDEKGTSVITLNENEADGSFTAKIN